LWQARSWPVRQFSDAVQRIQQRGPAEAFDSFRAALLQDADYMHLEVAEVFPTRRPEGE